MENLENILFLNIYEVDIKNKIYLGICLENWTLSIFCAEEGNEGGNQRQMA